MKICCFGDTHWSEYSSILRSMGEKYSTRLENLIKSVNWVFDIALEKKCDMIIGLGDFFDRESLNSREITALNEIDFSKVNVPMYFITGNHEISSGNLFYSSSTIFNVLGDKYHCIKEPVSIPIENVDICFLPYVLENNRKAVSDYFSNTNRKRIIFSHNDIAGVQMGKFKSISGFSIDDIENNCDLFVNGHLHNGESITRKIINLGNLTGQNFSEDASKYAHTIALIDTNTLNIEYIENPLALNFYKIDLTDIYSSLNKNNFKSNSVVSITCLEDNYDEIKRQVNSNKNIIASRISVSRDFSDISIVDTIPINVSNHLDRFRQYVLENIGSSDDILDELNRVLL